MKRGPSLRNPLTLECLRHHQMRGTLYSGDEGRIEFVAFASGRAEFECSRFKPHDHGFGGSWREVGTFPTLDEAIEALR